MAQPSRVNARPNTDRTESLSAHLTGSQQSGVAASSSNQSSGGSAASISASPAQYFRLKWQHVQPVLQKYAEMLNDGGGTLEIVHESIFAIYPANLLPASSSLSDHLHLDVITEVTKIWSNARLELVSEDASGPLLNIHPGYTHFVSYTYALGSVTFTINPLPTPFVAALPIQPKQRQGDQAQPMPFHKWFVNLQAIDISHLLPTSIATTSTTSYSIDDMAEYPPESTGTDWKFPSGGSVLSLALIKTYLIEPLLNAEETPRRLFFGIEDGVKCPIGLHVANFAVAASSFARESLSTVIFPTLRAEWFHLKFHRVADSIPSNWNEAVMATEIDSHFHSAAILLSKGRAASLSPVPNTNIQLFVPKSISSELRNSKSSVIKANLDASKSLSKVVLKEAWKALRKAAWQEVDNLNADLWTPRYVVEVEFKNDGCCGSFFRTELEQPSTNPLRLCFPFPHPFIEQPEKVPCNHPYTGLDPCAVWLRARADVNFDPAVAELFFSPLFRKIIITDSRWDIEQSLCHYLLGRPLDNVVTLESDIASPSTFHLLPLPTPYPRLIVASLSSLDVIHKIVRSAEKSSMYILLLANANQRGCRLEVDRALKLLLQDDATVVDVRALTTTRDPSPVSFPHLVPPSASWTPLAPTQENGIIFDLIPANTYRYVSESTVDGVFQTWLERQLPSDPPPWELLQHNRIYLTTQAQRLDSAISASWMSHTQLQVVPIHKVFPASGATCLLRSVAFRQSKGATVLWVSSASKTAPSQNYTRDLNAAIPSSNNRVLVCTDQLGSRKISKLLESLQRLVSTRPLLRIIWLNLRAVPVSALSQSKPLPFVVSPFVEQEDVLPLAAVLKVLGNGTTLDVVANHALTSPEITARHMFVFVLAATRGVCKPIEQWVLERYNSLAKFPPLLDVALSFAFVSAFAVDHHLQHHRVPDEALDLDLGDDYDDAMAEFRMLFPSAIPHTIKSSACLHPFLARLFLSCKFQLYWRNELLDWKSLSEAWMLTVTTLSASKRYDATLRTLLSERERVAQFSPLVIEAWSSTSRLKVDAAVKVMMACIVDILPEHIMGLHKYVLLSRLFRCAAQQADHPIPLLTSAITHATTAEQLSKLSTNPKERFTVRQNLAVMHGVAYSINPTHFSSSLETCDSTLRDLYSAANSAPNPDLVQLDDLILMGRKWCNSSNYWQQQVLSAEADPDNISQVVVRGWIFDPTKLKYGLFSERNAKKLTREEKRKK